MKNWIPGVLAVFCLACTPPQTPQTELVLSGTEKIALRPADEDMPTFKNKEVKVYFLSDSSEWYQLTYTHDYNGPLQTYKAFIGDSIRYDLADYEWLDDTTVTITMRNSSSEESYTTTLYGIGQKSGMTIPDDMVRKKGPKIDSTSKPFEGPQ